MQLSRGGKLEARTRSPHFPLSGIMERSIFNVAATAGAAIGAVIAGTPGGFVGGVIGSFFGEPGDRRNVTVTDVQLFLGVLSHRLR